MKHCLVAVATLCALGALGRGADGQAAERKSFEREMYSLETISNFGVGDQRFAALTETQRKALIESRNDLIAMLQAIQHRRDATKYASPGMVQKYGTSIGLAASIIDPETSILAAGVSDFAFVDKETIRLNFFAVLSSEGNIVVSEKAAVLKETDSGWRVDAFE